MFETFFLSTGLLSVQKIVFLLVWATSIAAQNGCVSGHFVACDVSDGERLQDFTKRSTDLTHVELAL